jgi:hypothetical protein
LNHFFESLIGDNLQNKNALIIDHCSNPKELTSNSLFGFEVHRVILLNHLS